MPTHAASSAGLPGSDSRGDFQCRGITAENEQDNAALTAVNADAVQRAALADAKHAGSASEGKR